MNILYMSEYGKPNTVDSTFEFEATTASRQFSRILIIDSEKFEEDNIVKISEPYKGDAIYRGHMLTIKQYVRLYNACLSKGIRLINNPIEYYNAHHIDQWYPHVSDYTAPTIFCAEDDDFYEVLGDTCWEKYFIKDAVKSLSTGRSPFTSYIDEIPDIVAAMKKFKGFIEGGLTIRKFEQYKDGSEERYFILYGKIYSRLLSVPEEVNHILSQAAKDINSNFFSVDIAQREDGVYRIVEIGDGGVSDTKNWNVYPFVSMMHDASFVML